MAKHIATGVPTQVAHPWQATARTAVAYLLAAIGFLAAALPILQEVMGDYLPPGWGAWITAAVAFLVALATLVTRLMALAKAQDFLAKIGLGTGVEKEPLLAGFGNADLTEGRVETSVEPAERTTYNIQVPEGLDFEAIADRIRNVGRSTGPHVRFGSDARGKHLIDADPTRHISFDTDPDLTGEVDIYVNGEKIGVAPIINQRVLYKLPELPAGENKVSAMHPERGVLYTFTFDSEPGKHVAE